MNELVTPADDELHPPASPDRWWTETCWFSLDQPGEDLSATIYPLFRPNLGVCSLAVYVWDATAYQSWEVPYGSFLWHLPMPSTPLSHLELEGLRYDVEEPLRTYRVRYRDADRLHLDLTYRALIEPHGVGIAHGHGHIDQPCRVTGEVRLGRRRVEIDSLAMRDRSWHVRNDQRSTRSAYTYALAGPGESFLAVSIWDPGAEAYLVRTGFLVRGGEKAMLVSGERRVTGRRDGYPTGIEIDAVDEFGRRVQATGRCRNRLANPATPGLFAWMSMTAWVIDGREAFGEDQDIWSPDRLGELTSGG